MRSQFFWDFRQRRLVVTDVSVKPIGPIFKGQAVQFGLIYIAAVSPKSCIGHVVSDLTKNAYLGTHFKIVYIYIYIEREREREMVIQNDCRGTIVQRQFRTKFGKQPPSDNSIEGGMHSFKRHGACVLGTEGRLRLKYDGTRAETRFSLSAKRTSPFKSAGASVQSTIDSRGVRISGSNTGCTML